jgi:hypothetical protein
MIGEAYSQMNMGIPQWPESHLHVMQGGLGLLGPGFIYAGHTCLPVRPPLGLLHVIDVEPVSGQCSNLPRRGGHQVSSCSGLHRDGAYNSLAMAQVGVSKAMPMGRKCNSKRKARGGGRL